MSAAVTQHGFSVTAGGVELPVTEADLTLDATWAPYARLQLTLAMPAPAILALLDPTTGARITGTFTASYPGTDRPAISRTFNLGLRTRPADYRADTVTITATSDEFLLMDEGLLATAAYTWPQADLRELVAAVLAHFGATLAPGTITATVPAGTAVQTPGQSYWDLLEPVLTAAGRRLWCDEAGVWHLDYSVYSKPGLVSLSAAVNLTELEDNIDRGEWYDSVVITWRWEGVDTYETAATGYAPGFARPRRTLRLSYDAPFPGAGAAADLLDRLSTRGHVDRLGAVSDYTVEPGREVSITYLDGSGQAGYVQAVQFQVPSCLMSVTTRGMVRAAVNSWISDAPGESWLDLEPGLTWTDSVAWLVEPAGAAWTQLPAGVSWLADSN